MEELRNVVWKALTTEHAWMALGDGSARRYPADVVPFAALEENTEAALYDLVSLMAPEEELFVVWNKEAGSLPSIDRFTVLYELTAFQMAPGTSEIAGTSLDHRIEPLSAMHGQEMVALTDVAFPGFFRPRTYSTGRYWGIRDAGELIAMAGERMAVPGCREISAVCTHPAHLGRGYATELVRYVLQQHRQEGLQSFLHVSDSNARAVGVYERLGFERIGEKRLTRVRRVR